MQYFVFLKGSESQYDGLTPTRALREPHRVVSRRSEIAAARRELRAALAEAEAEAEERNRVMSAALAEARREAAEERVSAAFEAAFNARPDREEDPGSAIVAAMDEAGRLIPDGLHGSFDAETLSFRVEEAD